MNSIFFIILTLFIYDIVGYTFIKKITGTISFYTIPIGFLIIITLFHLLSLVTMLYKLSFNIVLYPITIILLLFISSCIYISIFKLGYIKYQIKKFTSIDFYIACFFAISYSIFIIVFASDADQYLYQKMVQITLDTNQVYYSIDDPHQLNSIYLYNSLLIKIFKTNIFSYTYGVFRFIEGFFYIFLLFLYNQYAFNGRKLTAVMLVCGIFGLQMYSVSLFNQGLKLTQLFGNSGTYTLMYAMPFLYSLNLFVKNPNNFYILFLIFISPFAFTTTLYPFVFYFMLIYFYIFKNNEKNFLYVLLIYLYNIIFYLLMMELNIFIIFVFLLAVIITFRLVWISEYQSDISKLYFALLIFHMIAFLALSGITLYFTSSKIFILIFVLIYYKKYKFDKVLKYSLFILFVYFIYFNNYSETNILVITRRLIAFVPINLYYNVFLLKEKLIKIVITFSIIILMYLYNQQTMLYAPKEQIKQQGIDIPYYKVENTYNYQFDYNDKVYQQIYNPRAYNPGEFIFSTNQKQCKNKNCTCQKNDDCFLVLLKYQQSNTYDYYYNNYSDIVSEEKYNIIRKTNDQKEIENWIYSQLRR